ncbi:MAG: hypothetical protein ACPHCN_18805 [Mycobacterium sp.]
MIEISDAPTIALTATPFGAFMWLLVYTNKLLNRSDGRVGTLEKRITDLEGELRLSWRAEQVCLDNQGVLRRSLIEHGIDIPELAKAPLPPKEPQ